MTLLSSPLSLHDVQNVEGFAGRIVQEFCSSHSAHLSPVQGEDMLAHMIETAYRLSLRFDPMRAEGMTFSTYAGRIMRLRVADWYRKEFPGTRGGNRPVIESLDVEDRERLAQSTDFAPEVYETINMAVLSPDARDTFELIVQPMIERGLTLAEVAEERGLSRRDASKDVDALRREVRYKWQIAA